MSQRRTRRCPVGRGRLRRQGCAGRGRRAGGAHRASRSLRWRAVRGGALDGQAVGGRAVRGGAVRGGAVHWGAGWTLNAARSGSRRGGHRPAGWRCTGPLRAAGPPRPAVLRAGGLGTRGPLRRAVLGTGGAGTAGSPRAAVLRGTVLRGAVLRAGGLGTRGPMRRAVLATGGAVPTARRAGGRRPNPGRRRGRGTAWPRLGRPAGALLRTRTGWRCTRVRPVRRCTRRPLGPTATARVGGGWPPRRCRLRGGGPRVSRHHRCAVRSMTVSGVAPARRGCVGLLIGDPAGIAVGGALSGQVCGDPGVAVARPVGAAVPGACRLTRGPVRRPAGG
jgi:hypothetical protein